MNSLKFHTQNNDFKQNFLSSGHFVYRYQQKRNLKTQMLHLVTTRTRYFYLSVIYSRVTFFLLRQTLTKHFYSADLARIDNILGGCRCWYYDAKKSFTDEYFTSLLLNPTGLLNSITITMISHDEYLHSHSCFCYLNRFNRINALDYIGSLIFAINETWLMLFNNSKTIPLVS
jgi:hypothetical protein